MRILFGLVTFVTFGMLIGALFQLAFIRRLEDSYGAQFSFRRALEGRTHSISQARRGEVPSLYDIVDETRLSITGFNSLNSGYSHWAHDKEAVILRIGYIKPEVISWAPRIIVFHNFLSNEVISGQFGLGFESKECGYLISVASPRLHISTVVDAETGKGVKSKVRTSSGMFLYPGVGNDTIIQAIEKRISVYAQIPVENGELMQVLRYEKGQFYEPHNDFFSDTFNLVRGGQRIATMLMYLSDNVEGGETHFPMADDSGECSCGGKMVQGLCIKPAKGDAVLFWSMGLNGESDPKSVHAGCKVLSGEKWSATKWMRQSTATL